jgi:hypothetical protein
LTARLAPFRFGQLDELVCVGARGGEGLLDDAGDAAFEKLARHRHVQVGRHDHVGGIDLLCGEEFGHARILRRNAEAARERAACLLARVDDGDDVDVASFAQGQNVIFGDVAGADDRGAAFRCAAHPEADLPGTAAGTAGFALVALIGDAGLLPHSNLESCEGAGQRAARARGAYRRGRRHAILPMASRTTLQELQESMLSCAR